jgi:hypothetical protein
MNSGGTTCGTFYFNFTEGGTVQFQICTGNSSTAVMARCSGGHPASPEN